MSRIEQIRLAARTTIMMGVHGNGLTSLVWMKPTPRSTVIEFFFPQGFAHDYEYTTRGLGMVHYGFWGSQYVLISNQTSLYLLTTFSTPQNMSSSFTSPAFPRPKYVEGFQGNEIPIDGEAVARLCVERLTLASEVDD
ncbi:hypothetical protein BYT27DRAFT_7174884 [Phlegmacium glaucopus]|nr:hypothetical protein BYT27DRAFT_7174884 [Phlegmacium glaucopus]